MEMSMIFLGLAFAASFAAADDFEDRFKAAAKQVYEFDEETRRSGLAEMVRLAEKDEARLPALLAEIDLDTRCLVESFLRGRGYYFDPKATRRAHEILEALTAEPPRRQQFSRVLAVESPDPDRRKLVEEFLALGRTSIITLQRELAEFVAEPVGQPERVVKPREEVTCTLRLRNRGTVPLWFLAESLVPRATETSISFANAISIFCDSNQPTPTKKEAKERIVDLLALMRRVRPGEEFDCAQVRVPTLKPGLSLITMTNFRPEKLIGTAFPLEASFGGESLSLELRYPEKPPTARYFALAPTATPPWTCTATREGESFALHVSLGAELGADVEQPETCWWIAEGPDGLVLGHEYFGAEALRGASWANPGTVTATLSTQIPAGCVLLWMGVKCGSDGVTRIAPPIELRAAK